MKKKIEYTKSSGNIFADLGFPDAQDMLAKVDLAIQINEIIKKRKLTQTQAAKLLDIDQPKISALNKGKLAGFSLERLFRFLNILGQDITIKVSPKRSKTSISKINITTPRTKREAPLVQQNPVSRMAAPARRKK